MPDHTLFYVAFFLQALIVSVILPWRLLARLNHVLEQYPPSTHPKLYPKKAGWYRKIARIYGIANGAVFLAGMVTLTVLMLTERSGKWDHVIATWFFFLQCAPLLMIDLTAWMVGHLMRESSSTRTAVLRPRRLFDVVPRVGVVAAAVVYVLFCALVIYVKQFDYEWFGGYANIAGITAMNLLFAGILFHQVWGKKRNPHVSHEDRTKQIGTVAWMLIGVSIAATGFVAIAIALGAFELRAYQPVAQSLYFTLLALLSFQVYRGHEQNFDVYRDRSAV